MRKIFVSFLPSEYLSFSLSLCRDKEASDFQRRIIIEIIINSLTQLGCDYILMIIHCPMQILGLFFASRLQLEVDHGAGMRHVDATVSSDYTENEARRVSVERRNGIMNDKQSQPP